MQSYVCIYNIEAKRVAVPDMVNGEKNKMIIDRISDLLSGVLKKIPKYKMSPEEKGVLESKIIDLKAICNKLKKSNTKLK